MSSMPETEAKKTVIESQAMATKRAQEGYTYQQERGFDVAEKVAENESSRASLPIWVSAWVQWQALAALSEAW